MVRTMKLQTKDMDFVVRTRKEYDVFRRYLADCGFVSQKPGDGYEHCSLSQVFVKGDARMDLFLNKVCGKFTLSESMARRSEIYLETNNVMIHVCSLEDILLFKSMTDREGDLEDSENILKQKLLDWDSMMEEINAQIQSGEGVWITWITERMEILSDRGLNIPILTELTDLCDIYLSECFKK